MIYKDADDLLIWETQNYELEIQKDKLLTILLEQPSEIVYFTKEKELYGIITAGDILRSKNGWVEINNNFIKFVGANYLLTKRIFDEKRNINKVPVVDNNGCLIGEYVRWDDINYLERQEVDINIVRTISEEIGAVCLVPPVNRGGRISEVKAKLYEKIKALFSESGVDWVEYKSGVTYKNRKLIYVDTEEQYNARSVCEKVLDISTTYTKLLKDNEYEAKAYELFAMLKKQGVGCYTLGVIQTESDYMKAYNEFLEDKLKGIPIDRLHWIREEQAEEFFGELYSEEYYHGIVAMPIQQYSIDGVNKLKDNESEYFNVKAGERKTVSQLEEYDRTIYMFGPCVIVGLYVEDQYTISSYLQKKLNDNKMKCKVVNCGVWNDRRIDINRIMETQLKKGDIIIAYSYDKKIKDFDNLNLCEVAEKHNIPAEWTVNGLEHCNYKANKIYSDELFDMIKSEIYKDNNSEKNIDFDYGMYIKRTYIEKYFRTFDVRKYDRIGSIVMNCNPFTKGHRYLIEQAYDMVDYLIIFVVEEDKSAFSFEDRFKMVCEGTKDMERIKVVPSGNFILSQTTFPEYFMKIADEDIVANVDKDITIFADYVASQLNIKYRFVGEEPNDIVTNEYNMAMKRILPSRDIQLIEIARKEMDDLCISASRVRKYLESGEKDKAYSMVPESTREYIDR